MCQALVIQHLTKSFPRAHGLVGRDVLHTHTLSGGDQGNKLELVQDGGR